MRIIQWMTKDNGLDDSTIKEISRLLMVFLYIIPVIASSLAFLNYQLGLNEIAITIAIIPLFCGLSIWALKKGNLNLSIILLIFILVIVSTMSCVLGNGIHETGTIVFPMIVLFSSIVMNVRGVFVTAFLVICAIGFIIYCEQFTDLGIYPVPRARPLDLVAVMMLLIIHIFVTHSFSNITLKSLARAKEELHTQEKIKNEIVQSLDQRSLLLRQVHHRVKNHLSLLNSLIDIESMQMSHGKEQFKELSNSIHTIARAHDPLYHTSDYQQVSIKPYFEKLIASFSQSNGLINIELSIDEGLIFHETALSAGIVLQEILKILGKAPDNSMRITLLCAESLEIDVSLLKSNINYMDGSIEASLIHLLAEDLKAEAELGSQSIRLSFEFDVEELLLT